MREREFSLIFFNIKRKHRSHETTRLKKKKEKWNIQREAREQLTLADG